MGNELREIVYRLFTLDPVHIGIGQDIMGVVDLPIDREEETNVPRIPGTALKGAFRSHAARHLKLAAEENGEKTNPCPGDKPTEHEEGAAGELRKKPARNDLCPIEKCAVCQTFGYPSLKLAGEDGQEEQVNGHEGRVFFRDARLAFFPAMTNHGTLWFSTPGRAAAYLDLGTELVEDPFLQRCPELLFADNDQCFLAMNAAYKKTILVGWIQLTDLPTTVSEEGGSENLFKTVTEYLQPDKPEYHPGRAMWRTIADRTIFLNETNFSRVVEISLERRTCNKVDPETGTVADKALFSYEAMPRNCLLYSRLRYETAENGSGRFPLDVCNLARGGFVLAGIGGLQTRGLGSILLEKLDAGEGGTG